MDILILIPMTLGLIVGITAQVIMYKKKSDSRLQKLIDQQIDMDKRYLETVARIRAKVEQQHKQKMKGDNENER